ncbi:MAG: hypothetical protein GC129_02595 [Proteobacteria bacterium]|nr:hypothetical protein [Pseudomonadota bacterium]
MPRFILALCLLLATTCGAAHAQTSTTEDTPADDSLAAPATSVSDQNGNPVIQTQLIASHSSATPGQTITLAWSFTLSPHWHIYWKNAGDSGLPPELSAEEGSLGPLTFPLPKIIPIEPLTNYGYEDAVTFTIPYTVPDSIDKGDHTLNFAGNFLYCNDICLPGTVKLELPLTVASTAEENPDFHPVQNLAQAMPAGASAYQTSTTIQLVLPATVAASSPHFIPSENGIIEDAAPQSLNGTTLSIRKDPTSTLQVDSLHGLVLAGATGYTVSLPFSAGFPPSAAAPMDIPTMPAALLFAFLAGLILNLMPCVLPVLSLKVLHLIRHHHGADRIHHTLAYTLGVLGSFWAFAILIAVLNAGGANLGWGFHLQNPTFVAVLSGFMVVIALLFFGVFELGRTFTRLGATGNRKEHTWASFATGVLAVVVATPCTVPFMGAAMAYALTQSFAASLAIFTAIGLGMAAPFLLTVAFPRLLKWLPKPGAWMETFKHLLAWPMLLTALWLIYVFANQTDTFSTFLLLLLLLAVSFLLWLYGLKHKGWQGLAATVLIVTGFIGLHQHITMPESADMPWQDWSAQTVAEARTQRPVFVDFTADWCITCKVTEATVLSTNRVKALFTKYNVLPLKADWTNQDSVITEELEHHGRKGVPLFLLYLPGEASARILPQLITPGLLEKALSTKH